jgi:hypothetical protein
MKKLIVAILMTLIAAPAFAQFGGYGQRPTIQIRPNPFGSGYNINPGNGRPNIEVRPNPFGGGYNINPGFGQPTVQCRPNPFGGGVDCR